MIHPEEKLSSEEIFSGRIIRVVKDTVRLPNGRQSTREVAYHKSASAVLPILPDGRLVLVEQYRYAVGEVVLEIPAGILEEGEDPMETAKRELMEETGYLPGKLTELLVYYSSPGFTNEKIHIYLAEELTPAEKDPDFDEFLETRVLTLPEALDLIKQGDLTDGKSLIAICYYALLRGHRIIQ